MENINVKRKRMNKIISISFLIAISILLLLSGIPFPNVFSEGLPSYNLTFLNIIAIIFLSVLFIVFIIYNTIFNIKLTKIEEKEDETENNTT